jgi:chromosome segregation ATPase
MKSAFLIPVAALMIAAFNAQAQAKIWRCGNTYTNDAAEAKVKMCKPMEGGNVTVVEGTRPNGGGSSAGSNGSSKVASAAPTSAGSQRVDSSEQRARDSEARAILESELKKAEARHADLLKEWNNGEPEKQGPEHKNYQKYLDRVAELKASIARSENDLAGLKRELARQGGTAPASK